MKDYSPKKLTIIYVFEYKYDKFFMPTSLVSTEEYLF